MTFLSSLLALISSDLVVTIGMCILASFTVAVVMRFFVKTCFVALDKYMNAKHADDKVLATYSTIKSAVYCIIAGVLVGISLHRLMAVCTFPSDNTKALAFFYFIPMYALQWFLDVHMKKIAYSIFGLKADESENDSPEDDTEEVHEKKRKVYSKKVKYIVDDEGNEVLL